MPWIDELKKMKKDSQKTTAQIAIDADIPEPTLEKLFAGKTPDPRLSTVSKVVHYFGHTLDELFPEHSVKRLVSAEAISVAKKYDSLDPQGQTAVHDVINGALNRIQAETVFPSTDSNSVAG